MEVYKNDISFENVWTRVDSKLSGELVDFWMSRKVITQESQATERSRQAVVLLRNKEGALLGVSTATKSYFKPVGHDFYFYRCFIDTAFRIPGLDIQLTKKAVEVLEKHAKETSDDAVGVLALVQGNTLKQRVWAIWRSVNFFYYGKDKNGNPIRIYYFRHAKIK